MRILWCGLVVAEWTLTMQPLVDSRTQLSRFFQVQPRQPTSPTDHSRPGPKSYAIAGNEIAARLKNERREKKRQRVRTHVPLLDVPKWV